MRIRVPSAVKRAVMFVALALALRPGRFVTSASDVLPRHRVVAFYAIPGVKATGPAWEASTPMLAQLRSQAAEYEALDPQHPVISALDIVVSIADQVPGAQGTYSHHARAETVRRFVDFCQASGLLLFLDFQIGRADPVRELEAFHEYLALPFVHVAIDAEWMFPRGGVPRIHSSHVLASDINPVIDAVAEIRDRYDLPRKIIILHQFRASGEDKGWLVSDPRGAEILDKHNLRADPRVDVVVHVDGVATSPKARAQKVRQYASWVGEDMKRYRNFAYGGIKVFYQIEDAPYRLPAAEILGFDPAPLIVTYGH